MPMVRWLMVMIVRHCLVVSHDAQHRKLCYSFWSINQILWQFNQSWRQKKVMVMGVFWSSIINPPWQKPTRNPTWYQEQQGRVKTEIPPHAHYSPLNQLLAQYSLATRGGGSLRSKKGESIVWTEAFGKEMRNPMSRKKYVTMQNICKGNDNSTNSIGSHTTAT